MHRVIFGLMGATLAVTAVLAAADGIAVGVNPNAVAQLNAQDRTLVVGADVSVGERVITGPTGQVQILFSDATRLVVGPNSSLLIEQYLLRNDGTADKLAVKALAGTFRFISGHSAKSAYQINTPTAAIGVRGTKFDIVVTRSDTLVMLYEGALTMCSPSEKCVDVSERCQIGSTSASSAELFLRPDPDRLPLASAFRYAKVQTPLLPDFRVSGPDQCLTETTEDVPSSLSKPQPTVPLKR